MSNQQRNPKTAEPGRLRYSITRKLNKKLFFRLMGLFLSLNIMICVIAATALVFYSESKVIGALKTLSEKPPPQAGVWMDMAGMQVRAVARPTIWQTMPWPFERYLPYEADHAVRGIRAASAGFPGTVRSLAYVVSVNSGGTVFEVELLLGTFILYFIYAFAALLIIEFFTLLSRTAEDRRMVRKTLDPIAELARTAQSLNAVNKQLDMEKMMALTGRLDGIDGQRLDTRIPVDDLQEELKKVKKENEKMYTAYQAGLAQGLRAEHDQ